MIGKYNLAAFYFAPEDATTDRQMEMAVNLMTFLTIPASLHSAIFRIALVMWLVSYVGAAEAGMLYKAKYQYDLRGMVTNLMETYGGDLEDVRSLRYDRLGRMTHEKIGAHEVYFQYDRLGNRLREIYPSQERVFHYNRRNELERHEFPDRIYELSYDSNGSLTQKVVGATSTRYEWDSRGRLTCVLTNEVELFRATYAGGLNRQKKQEGTTSKTYRHDGETAIQEVDESGDVNELVRGDRGAVTVGGILYSADGQGTNTYTYNGVGSTVLLTGDDETARAIKYDAFGNVLEADEGVNAERLANTKELDQSTGLYFHGARYYDSETGRYISRDPARDGLNHYIYAHNAPLTFVDPTGLRGVTAGAWDGIKDVLGFAWNSSVGLGNDIGGSLGYALGSDAIQYHTSWTRLKTRAISVYQGINTLGGTIGYNIYDYVLNDPEGAERIYGDEKRRWWNFEDSFRDQFNSEPSYTTSRTLTGLFAGRYLVNKTDRLLTKFTPKYGKPLDIPDGVYLFNPAMHKRALIESAKRSIVWHKRNGGTARFARIASFEARVAGPEPLNKALVMIQGGHIRGQCGIQAEAIPGELGARMKMETMFSDGTYPHVAKNIFGAVAQRLSDVPGSSMTLEAFGYRTHRLYMTMKPSHVKKLGFPYQGVDPWMYNMFPSAFLHKMSWEGDALKALAGKYKGPPLP